jgi:hypothetical protein
MGNESAPWLGRRQGCGCRQELRGATHVESFVRAFVPLRYSPAVAIVACPFCREMFDQHEASSCPVCGISLQSLEKLPPAKTLLHELEDDGVPPLPEHVPFALTYGGRGRGVMVGLGILGLALFFSTWVHLTLPEVVDLSGFDLARRLGWSWGAGVAWAVIVPTVASRRTVAELRGARFAAAFLSLIPGVTAVILALRPPHGGLVPVRFTYGWPLWATMCVSFAATAVGARLGGRLDVLSVSDGTPAALPRRGQHQTGSSEGQTLH